jgi:hypothetical protein
MARPPSPLCLVPFPPELSCHWLRNFLLGSESDIRESATRRLRSGAPPAVFLAPEVSQARSGDESLINYDLMGFYYHKKGFSFIR